LADPASKKNKQGVSLADLRGVGGIFRQGKGGLVKAIASLIRGKARCRGAGGTTKGVQFSPVALKRAQHLSKGKGRGYSGDTKMGKVGLPEGLGQKKKGMLV